MKKLPESQFVQIHRRFIINTDKIMSVDDNKVILSGHEKTELPISRAQRKAFYENFLQND